MFDRIRLRLAFWRFVRDPTRTDRIFDVVDLSTSMPHNEPAIAAVEQEALGNPGFRSLWEARWVPRRLTIEDLLAYPEGSLGHAYHEHIKRNPSYPSCGSLG